MNVPVFVPPLALSGMTIGIIIGAVVLVLVIIFAAIWISIKNGLVRMVNQTEESWSTIDVYLKKRYDLIPNLVATVKGYAKHEEDTLTKVISARNAIGSCVTMEDRMAAEKRLGSELRMFVTRTEERYPDLKANVQFMELIAQLKSIESELVSARKYYNGTVRVYNDKIMVFPSSMVAKGMKLKKRPYFELDTEEERRAPKVEF